MDKENKMKKEKIIKFICEKRDLIIYTTYKMFDMGIAFYLNWIIVRKLSEYDYGVYSIVLTILGLLTTFGFSWTSSSLLYFGVEEKVEYGSLNRTFWARNIILGISYFIVMILFVCFYKKLDEYITEPLSMYLFIWMSIKILSSYLICYFLAIEKRKVSVSVSIFTKLFAVIMITFKMVSLYHVLRYSIISEIISLIWIFKVNKSDFGKFIFDKKIFKRVLSFGLWQIFGFSGLYLINFGDNFVLKHFLTMEDVAIYNVAYKLYIGMSGFCYLFSSYFAPKVTRAIKTKNKNILIDIFYCDRKYMSLLLLIPHLIVIVFAKKIVVLFFGINYIGASSPLIILAIGSALQYFTVFNILIYNCFKKYKIMQCFNILQAVLNVIFDILFVQYFGILGAALGTLVSFIISTGIETIYGEMYLRRFIKNIENSDSN